MYTFSLLLCDNIIGIVWYLSGDGVRMVLQHWQIFGGIFGNFSWLSIRKVMRNSALGSGVMFQQQYLGCEYLASEIN